VPILLFTLGENAMSRFYIGTILLERNRWAKPKTPTYLVSEWVERFREAGFDGMELWEYHATLCSEAELQALTGSPLPVAVYNSYCGFDDASVEARRTAAEMARRFGAGGVKFNVGGEPRQRSEYLKNLAAWEEDLPDGCRMLCECHGGTIVEEPAEAERFFRDFGLDRVEIIVHAFGPDLGQLHRWFDAFGPAVTLAHVQISGDGGGRDLLENNSVHALRALEVMQDAGFTGSYTLEFTKGTREPDENIDGLWGAALRDLRFLREALP